MPKPKRGGKGREKGHMKLGFTLCYSVLKFDCAFKEPSISPFIGALSLIFSFFVSMTAETPCCQVEEGEFVFEQGRTIMLVGGSHKKRDTFCIAHKASGRMQT